MADDMLRHIDVQRSCRLKTISSLGQAPERCRPSHKAGQTIGSTGHRRRTAESKN